MPSLKEVHTELPWEKVKETIMKGNKRVRGILKESAGKRIKNTEKEQQFKRKVSYGARVNLPIFTIFSNYFNILYQNESLQKQQSTKIVAFVNDGKLLNTIDLAQFGSTNIILDIEGNLVNFCFSKYKSSGEVCFDIDLDSRDDINISGQYFYTKVLEAAIIKSNLKGTFIQLPDESLNWKILPLNVRTFDDIYLPDETYASVKLYSDVYNQNDLLMRFLLVGVPGSGKTESALILMNELNKLGVTIIKTSLDNLLGEKIKLAELLAPTLLILDDIDLQLGSRSSGGFNPAVLSKFLDVLDGTNKMENQVGIIATTNSVELLDLAAQRPGRFEKVVIFDSITKDNIKNIILKALKYEFNLIDPKLTAPYIHSSIIDAYSNAKVTGAHIYNSIKVLKLNTDALQKEVTTSWLIKEIDHEIKTIDKVRKSKYLKDRFEGSNNGPMGFKMNYDNEKCIDEIEETGFRRLY